MTTPTSVTELLAECEARDIRLLAAPDGSLTVDAPGVGLTDDLLAQLRAHKQDILKAIEEPTASVRDCESPDLEFNGQHRQTRTCETKNHSLGAMCRCGATTWRDVLIHGGRSIRRDCATCGRFLDFPVWYSPNTVRNEQ